MKTKISTFLVALLLCVVNANAVLPPVLTTVTVGATGDYTSLSAATTGVGTITTPLIIELKADYTQTSDDINFVAGADATNTVTIRPQASLTVAGTGAYVWRMNGCSYVTIDGRVGGTGNIELTLNADTLAASKNTIALLFENDATHNTVQYVNLRSAVTMGTWKVGSAVAVDKGTIKFGNGITTGNSNNTIDHCDLGPIHPYTGTPSIAILSSSSVASAPNSNLVISNNNIYDYYATDLNKYTVSVNDPGPGTSTGVTLYSNTTASTISGNNFYQTLAINSFGNANGPKTAAIMINNPSGAGFVVKDNYIGGSEPMCGGTLPYTNLIANNQAFNGICAIVSPTATPVTAIYNNTIKNLNLSSSGTVAVAYHSAGIYVAGSAKIGVNESDLTAGNIIGDQSSSTVGANASIKYMGTNNNSVFSGITINSVQSASLNVSNNKVAGITLTYNGSRTTNLCGINVFETIASQTITATIQNNEIGNNDINVGNTNMSLQGNGGKPMYGIYVQKGEVGTIYNISTNKIGNFFNDQQGTNQTYVYGIYVSTAVLCPVTISGNEIRDLVFTNGRVNDTPINWGGAIFCGSQGNGSVINNNIISNISGLGVASTNVIGIQLNPTVSAAVMNVYSNEIYNLSSNVTRKLGQYGTGCNGILTFGAGGGLSPTINVYNNLIRLGYDRNGSQDMLATNYIGIRDTLIVSGSSNINYIGNTIYIGGSNVALNDTISSMGICIATSSTVNPTRTVKNNLIVNARSNTTGSGAPAFKIKNGVNAAGVGHYAIGTGGSATALTNFISNNNDYVASGTGGVLGRFANKVDAIDLAAIQSNTGGDLNSINVVPIFINATGATPNLHLNQSNYNNNENLKYAAVLSEPFDVDFDGNPRHGTNPTIGANEYTGLVSAVNKTATSAMIISVKGNDITIHNTSSGNVISVYNVNGQNVKQLLSNEGITSFNMQSGVYMIKVNNEVSKIVI